MSKRQTLTLKPKGPLPAPPGDKPEPAVVSQSVSAADEMTQADWRKVLTNLGEQARNNPAIVDLAREVFGFSLNPSPLEPGLLTGVRKPIDGGPCSNCGEPRDRPGQYYCSKCNATYQRDYQATLRERLRKIKDSGLVF